MSREADPRLRTVGFVLAGSLAVAISSFAGVWLAQQLVSESTRIPINPSSNRLLNDEELAVHLQKLPYEMRRCVLDEALAHTAQSFAIMEGTLKAIDTTCETRLLAQSQHKRLQGEKNHLMMVEELRKMQEDRYPGPIVRMAAKKPGQEDAAQTKSSAATDTTDHEAQATQVEDEGDQDRECGFIIEVTELPDPSLKAAVADGDVDATNTEKPGCN